MNKMQFYMSLASVAMSIYVTYILYFILAEFGPLCVAIYAVTKNVSGQVLSVTDIVIGNNVKKQ